MSRTFEVVERLRAAGTTILMVEQMARQALRVSDRAYVLEHGRIVGEGDSADLLDEWLPGLAIRLLIPVSR